MKCRQAEQWMDAALDVAMARDAGEPGSAAGTLPHGWREQLEAHLESCPRCRRLWTQLHAAHAALRVPRPVPVPEGLLADFHRRVAQERRPAPVRPSPWMWLFPLASTAAGVAAAWMIAARLAPLPQYPSVASNRGDEIRSPISEREDRGVDSPAAPAADDAAPPRTKAARGAAKAPNAAPSTRSRGWFAHEPMDRLAKTDPQPHTDFFAAEGGREALLRLRTQNQTVAGRDDAKANQAEVRDAEARKMAVLQEGRGLPAAAEAASQLRGGFGRSNQDGAVPPNTNLFYSEELAAAQNTQQDPPELRVSPAVLTALQRTVEPSNAATTVRQAAQQLAQAADVAVEVDPRVATRAVTLREQDVPLWKALEVLAEQSDLQVLPEKDHLLLKPAQATARMPRITGAVAQQSARPAAKPLSSLPSGAAGAAGPAPAGAATAPAAPAPAAAPPAQAAPVLPEIAKVPAARNRPRQEKQVPRGFTKEDRVLPQVAEPRTSSANSLAQKMSRATVNAKNSAEAQAAGFPDRKVWGEAWGRLPERGFAVPAPEEIPPQTLDLSTVQNGNATQSQAPSNRQLSPSNILRRSPAQNNR